MSAPFRDAPDRPASVGLFATWWRMEEAHQECAGLEPIHDDDLVLHFSGSGASCMVFAKDIRAVLEKLEPPSEGKLTEIIQAAKAEYANLGTVASEERHIARRILAALWEAK